VAGKHPLGFILFCFITIVFIKQSLKNKIKIKIKKNGKKILKLFLSIFFKEN
jgi:putative Mn2+ efflux pump MntP